MSRGGCAHPEPLSGVLSQGRLRACSPSVAACARAVGRLGGRAGGRCKVVGLSQSRLRACCLTELPAGVLSQSRLRACSYRAACERAVGRLGGRSGGRCKVVGLSQSHLWVCCLTEPPAGVLSQSRLRACFPRAACGSRLRACSSRATCGRALTEPLAGVLLQSRLRACSHGDIYIYIS